MSPPDPQVLGTDDFAVNQQSEQIIFEVGQDTVTAHVFIRYAGAPEQFAWIVPVPNVPTLDLSPAVAFALLDDATRPIAGVSFVDLCPVQEYRCRYHAPPICESPEDDGAAYDDDGATAAGDDGADGGGFEDGGGTGGDGGEPPGIDVLDMQMVGSYETVTFSATEADLAVAWLQENGFIVNDTMTPYMMPYVEAGMVFVAAKLVPGAGIDAIEPLKITYQGVEPMIPLILTAVAAEPHLTVTTYIYGEDGFDPIMHPVMPIDQTRIAQDINGRINYPQVLARTVDDVGGNGWVVEYRDLPPQIGFGDASGCCGSEIDSCGIGGDTLCQCPGDPFDSDDCGQIPGLLPAVELMQQLQAYPRMTRLTTRISPEEMNYDPSFRLAPGAPVQPRMSLVGTEYVLWGCEAQVIDQEELLDLQALQGCAATYCGEGECVMTAGGPGCECAEGNVARAFTDLDGLPSVTCVPEIPTVDLAANTELPDACANFECLAGTCVDLGGVPACDCDALAAGTVDSVVGRVFCAATDVPSGTQGADNYTDALQNLPVCAPPPPQCGEDGWLESSGYEGRHGEACATSIPAPEAFVIPPAPTCADIGLDEPGEGDDDDGGKSGCGCVASDTHGLGGTALFVLLVAARRLRRRRFG